MASTNVRRNWQQERINSILSFFKENPSGYIKGVELRKLFNVSTATIDRDVQVIRKQYPGCLKHNLKKGYYWVEPKKTETKTVPVKKETKSTPEKKEEVKAEAPKSKYPDYRTEEGYSDPTAFAAMNTMPDTALPRDIFVFVNSCGNEEKWLIIAANSYRATCLQLQEVVSYSESAEVVPVLQKGEPRYYYNPTRLTTRPLKYAREKIGELSEVQFKTVLASLNLYLGLSEGVKRVEVPVEVVKEVIKEVPVEVVKEVIKEVPVEVVKEVEKVVEVPVNDEDASIGVSFEEYATLVEDRDRLETEYRITCHELYIYRDLIDRLLPKAKGSNTNG